ncbi:DUF5819 family protein [Streptomyces lavendulocolor]|uniref:DUF5819 family protein n=1 Tax=Streptomyces lavendulocolor TaxID=67316 RepID=A0ABV2W176_9ACTN
MDSYDKEAGGRARRATDTEGSGTVPPPAAPSPAAPSGPESAPESGIGAPSAPAGEASSASSGARCADRATEPATAAGPGAAPAAAGRPGAADRAPRRDRAAGPSWSATGARPDAGSLTTETKPHSETESESRPERHSAPETHAADGRAGAGGMAGRAGIAALSLPYQVVAAVSLAVVGMFACMHLAMAFLHVAPSNTLTKQHGEAVDDWVFPEFEQNWKLFAPNPLQQNISVHARAEVVGTDGGRRTTGWIDLSGDDGEAIRGNLFPSHVNQNELRRGWDFYVNSHTDANRPNGMRGQLSERYIRRIAMLRLDAHHLGGRIERIQLRSATRGVEAPHWSDEKTDTRPYYRVLPWWTVTAADLPGGVTGGRTEADK